jgi:hypothetical protein
MRRLLGRGVLALTLVLALPGAAGAATAASAVTKQDTASTKAFIALQERLDVVTIRSAPAINAAEHAFAAQIRTGCPGVLAHLPKQLSHRQGIAVSGFQTESVLALGINAFAPARRLADRIAARQRRLRFSDPALQWQVRVNGAANAAFFALRPPNLCTDGRQLASSRFTRITPLGRRFVAEGLTLGLSAGGSPSSFVRTMRSYAPAAAAAALTRLPLLQRKLDHVIPIAAQSKALARVLGLGHRSTINFAALGTGS